MREMEDFYKAMSCSNRTFMELKLESGQDVSEEAAVLIVPLWN